MKKYLYITTFLFLMPFLTTCKKENNEEKNEEHNFKEITDIENHLNEIGAYEQKQESPMSILPLSEQQGEVVYRYDEVEGKSDYYIPIHTESHCYGFEAVDAMPPVKSDAIWPGNLVQGNSLADGNLAPIPISTKRKPGRIYLSVVSPQKGMTYYKEVEKFTGSDVTQAMNELLVPFTGALPADVSYMQQNVQSMDQVAYYLDMSKDDLDKLSDNQFENIDWKIKKERIMVKFKQVYYTMVYDFEGIKESFVDNITWNDIRPYTDTNNPMCYISSVSYGRYFVLLYETTASRKGLQDAIDHIYSDKKGDITDADKAIIKNAQVRMFAVGGDAASALETIKNGNVNAIEDFVIKGAEFSETNVGAPIEYSVKYLYNSAEVPIYKSIDVNLFDTKYLPEKRSNNIEITIKSISSKALVLTGGNYREVSHESNFTVGPISVKVKNGNTVISTKTYNPNITKEGAKGAVNKSINYTLRLGELGEIPDEQIEIRFPVTYFIKRYGGGSSSASRSYEKVLILNYDRISKQWKVFHTDNTQNLPFQAFVIQDWLNFCNLDFCLDYSFKADRYTYPVPY